jgi:hypothetical protein
MTILIIIFVLAVFIYDTVMWGWVLLQFWGWFVLPVFPELPALDFGQAVGLMLVIGLFKSVSGQVIKSEYKESWGSWLILALPWITLIFGWLAWMIFI